MIEITETGLAMAGVSSEGILSSPDQVVAMWLSKLPVQAALFLREVWRARPHPVTFEELSVRAGRTMTSSQFKPALKTLRRNGLIEAEDGQVRMSEDLLAVRV